MDSRLTHMRTERGIRQVELARKSGLSTQTIRRAESGRVTAPVTLHKIVNALNSLSVESPPLDVAEVFPDSKT